MTKKKVVVIILLVLLYGFIMFMLFYKNNNDINNDKEDIIYYKNDVSKYIVIGNTSNLMYRKNKWSRVGNKTIQNSSNHFKTYNNNDYLGEYILQYGTNWNLFNDKSEFVDYDGDLFAYSDNFDIQLIRFNSSEITDDDKSIIIKKYGNKMFDNLITNEVVNVDFDNNGQIDKIICLSYNGMDLEESDYFYNLVFINLNGVYYTIIDQNKNNSNTLELPIYKINRLFSYENENYIIIEETYGIDSDSPSSINNLYKFKNDKFVNVIND